MGSVKPMSDIAIRVENLCPERGRRMGKANFLPRILRRLRTSFHELALRGEEKFERFVAKGKHGGGLGLDGGRDGAWERDNV